MDEDGPSDEGGSDRENVSGNGNLSESSSASSSSGTTEISCASEPAEPEGVPEAVPAAPANDFEGDDDNPHDDDYYIKDLPDQIAGMKTKLDIHYTETGTLLHGAGGAPTLHAKQVRLLLIEYPFAAGPVRQAPFALRRGGSAGVGARLLRCATQRDHKVAVAGSVLTLQRCDYQGCMWLEYISKKFRTCVQC